MEENNKILNSWKDIAKYLNHDQRTCFRWEKQLGLPVHRFSDSTRSKVFAYKEEIDDWLEDRKKNGIVISNPHQKKIRLMMMGILVLLVSTISLLYLFIHSKTSNEKNQKIPTLAILPFENLSSKEYDEYLASGISKELSNCFALSSYVKTILLSSLTEYEIPLNALDRAEKFNIDYLLTGDLRRDNNDLIINVMLSSAQNRKSLLNWEGKTTLVKIDKFKQDIVNLICEKINIPGIQILPIMVSNKNGEESEAFDSYLKGDFILNHINSNSDPWKLYHQGKYYYSLSTLESNVLAIELFNNAIVEDREFAQAYIGLSRCYMNYLNLGWDNNVKWLNLAEDLLIKAQAIIPDLPDYFSSLTKLLLLKYLCFSDGTKRQAWEIVSKGVDVYPENPDLNVILSYIYFLDYGENGIESDFNKALEYAERSFWQNPFSINNLHYTELLLLNQEYNQGQDICNLLVDLDPSRMTEFRMGELQYFSGNLESSEQIFIQFKDHLNLKIGSLFYRGMIAAQKNELNKAQRIIEQLENISLGLFGDELRMSSIFFGLGDENNGLLFLDRLFSKPSSQKIKYQFLKYISLDKNFNAYENIIKRRLYDSKTTS